MTKSEQVDLLRTIANELSFLIDLRNESIAKDHNDRATDPETHDSQSCMDLLNIIADEIQAL